MANHLAFCVPQSRDKAHHISNSIHLPELYQRVALCKLLAISYTDAATIATEIGGNSMVASIRERL